MEIITFEAVNIATNNFTKTRNCEYALGSAAESVLEVFGSEPLVTDLVGKMHEARDLADKILRELVHMFAECLQDHARDVGIEDVLLKFLSYHGYEGWSEDVAKIIEV